MYLIAGLIIVAAWIMFLALGGSEFDEKKLEIGFYPPIGVRLALLLHAEHQFAVNCDPQAVVLIEAAAYGAQAGANSSLGGFTPTQIAENIGFNGAHRNWGSVAAHVGALAITRKSLEEKLLPRRIITGLPRVDWY